MILCRAVFLLMLVGLAACHSSGVASRDAAPDEVPADVAADVAPDAPDAQDDVATAEDVGVDQAVEAESLDRADEPAPAIDATADGPREMPPDVPPVDAQPASTLAFTNCIRSLVGSASNVFAVDRASAAAADFNHDGKADLAFTTSPDNHVITLRSKGDGSFQIVSNRILPTGAGRVVTADFNKDGIPDVVVGGPAGASVSLLLGAADGSVGAPVSFAGPAASGIAVGDVDGDGATDLVVGNGAGMASTLFAVFLGAGAGTFSPVSYVQALTQPTSPVMGDFDRDGKMDIAVTARGVDKNHFNDGVVVLRGAGNASFGAPVPYETAQNPLENVLGDFTSDGIADIITTHSGTNAVTLLVGNGDGTFQPARSLPNLEISDSTVTADFDRDGRLDLAMKAYGNHFFIVRGNGDGTFASGTYFPLDLAQGPLALGDFDGDGLPDLVVAHNNGVGSIGEICALLNRSK